MIEFHRVKKSPLITGIVDRIKINSEQLFPFSESELSDTFCKLQYNLRLFRLFRDDSSGMDKSSSAKCLLYSDVAKGEPSPTETARTRKKQRRKRQSRSWRFSFHEHFTAFFLFISFFQLLYFIIFFYTFFTHEINPHPHPRPTPTTHDPRPRPTTHTHDPRPTTHDI